MTEDWKLAVDPDDDDGGEPNPPTGDSDDGRGYNH